MRVPGHLRVQDQMMTAILALLPLAAVGIAWALFYQPHGCRSLSLSAILAEHEAELADRRVARALAPRPEVPDARAPATPGQPVAPRRSRCIGMTTGWPAGRPVPESQIYVDQQALAQDHHRPPLVQAGSGRIVPQAVEPG